MKKNHFFLSILLIAALVFSVGSNAFAAEYSEVGYRLFSFRIPDVYEVYARSDAEYANGSGIISSYSNGYINQIAGFENVYALAYDKEDDYIQIEVSPIDTDMDLRYMRDADEIYLDIVFNAMTSVFFPENVSYSDKSVIQTSSTVFFSFDDLVIEDSTPIDRFCYTICCLDGNFYVISVSGLAANSSSSEQLKRDVTSIAESIILAGNESEPLYEDFSLVSTADANGFRSYYIKSGPIKLTLDDGNHIILTPDVSSDDPDLIQSGIDPQVFASVFPLMNCDLYMYKNADRYPPDFSITLRVKDGKYPGTDYRKMSQSDIQENAFATYSTFPGAYGYELVSINDIPYYKFYWNGGSELRYATIVNGDMIYYFASKTSGKLDASEEELLFQVIESAEY